MQSRVSFYEIGLKVRCVVSGIVYGTISKNKFGRMSYKPSHGYKLSNRNASRVDAEIIKRDIYA